MLAELSLVDFNQMAQRLERRRMVPADQSGEALEDIRTYIQAIQFARSNGLAEREEFKTLCTTFSAERYVWKMFDLLKTEIPLMDVDDVMEDDEGPRFIPSLLGLNAYTWDEIEEICSNSGGYSLDVFLILILVRMQGDLNDEYWTHAREELFWPEFEPVCVRDPYPDSAIKSAMKYLEEHDAADLIGALEVGFNAPNNVFYAANPEDGSWEDYEWTTHNVAWLIVEWAEAKPIYERGKIAREAIEKNPERLLVLIDAMRAAGMLDEEKKPDAIYRGTL